jgi:hypothetical protein
MSEEQKVEESQEVHKREPIFLPRQDAEYQLKTISDESSFDEEEYFN